VKSSWCKSSLAKAVAGRSVTSVAIRRVTGGCEAYTVSKQAVRISSEIANHCDADAVDKAEGSIRSFFRWLTLCDPELVGMATRILAIPVKRTDRRLVQSLARDEIDALLAAPDSNRWQGRRDRALLMTLYNTGARVSEITAVQRDHVQFGSTTFVHLFGKGRKQRNLPLWPQTTQTLKAWFRELESTSNPLAFPSARGQRLSRNGVDHILKQAIAHANYPSLNSKRIHPHAIRHTTGAHLLQSGADISVIALWLGHESIETTHMYVEADMATRSERCKSSPRRVHTFGGSRPTIASWRSWQHFDGIRIMRSRARVLPTAFRETSFLLRMIRNCA
jgi:site-specific recombinase XerD